MEHNVPARNRQRLCSSCRISKHNTKHRRDVCKKEEGWKGCECKCRYGFIENGKYTTFEDADRPHTLDGYT